MDHFLRPPRRPLLSVLGLALSLSLVAAACGGAEETVSADTGSQSDSAESADSTADTGSADEAEAEEAQEPAEESAQEPAEELVEAASHSFPDLATTNIADGSTINLATELAGGDTAVLLWFFAPH